MSVATHELLVGVALDLVCGDPQWLPHPVRAIGLCADVAERFWRASRLPVRVSGGLFFATVLAATVSVVRIAPRWLAAYWIYSFLACRDLDRHAQRVLVALETGDLVEARRRLSWIVGRDTAHLQEPEIMRAVVETVAENLSDGVIAPLLYLAIGGPVGMAAYKAINTLDSIVGHRNERYRDFGLASAKMDDLANFVPARLSALLVWCAAAFVPGLSGLRALRVTLRDGGGQPSPNAGFPEAAVAGALGVQLGGLNFYGGMPCRKATLGDPMAKLDRGVYTRLRIVLYVAELIFVAVICQGRRRQ
ncbi:MAG: adenosylcobinamide-phosphate synthase CbiB [Bryobacteraceae bacterium]